MSVVAVPSLPMYQLGFGPAVMRQSFPHLIRAPKIPLHQLGWLGVDPAKIVGASAPVAATATTAIVASIGAGTSWGAAAGPIGAGVGLLVGVIAGLWAAHEARVKGATQENHAINSAVQTFDAGMKAIFAAANNSDPSQNVPGPVAAQQVQQLYAQFWAQMVPFTRAPGAADTSGGGANCGDTTLNPNGPCKGTPHGHMCDRSCTATCCVGCQDIYPTMLQAVGVLNSPSGGSVEVCTVFGSKYGAVERSGYTLSYNPPKLASSVSGLLDSLTGGGSTGVGGSSLPLILAAVAVLAVLR